MKRECGGCNLCCTLLLIDERAFGGMHKPAFKHCGYECKSGCSVYNTPKMPMSCKLWDCAWIVSAPATENLPRPDKCHYVIDVYPGKLGINDEEFEVLQVYCDPLWPKTHEDPTLREFIDRQMKIAQIMYCADASFIMIPPSLTSGRGWLVSPTQRNTRESSVQKMNKALGVKD